MDQRGPIFSLYLAMCQLRAVAIINLAFVAVTVLEFMGKRSKFPGPQSSHAKFGSSFTLHNLDHCYTIRTAGALLIIGRDKEQVKDLASNHPDNEKE